MIETANLIGLLMALGLIVTNLIMMRDLRRRIRENELRSIALATILQFTPRTVKLLEEKSHGKN